MRKKNNSTDSSKPTKRASKPAKSRLAEDLIEGFTQAIAHNRGELMLRTRQIYIPDDIDVRALREKMGLSQSQFADRYCFNTRTLQEWEQGRRKPDSAVRAYLTVIDRNPSAVKRALSR